MTEAFAIRFITEQDGRPLRWTYLRNGFHGGGAAFETPGTGPHYRLLRSLGIVPTPLVGAPEELS
jgi:hypothetical protein